MYLSYLQICEAIIVEVLDRALPLAQRGDAKESELHKTRMASAERTAVVWGLQPGSLVTL